MLHLFDYSRFAATYEAPLEVTQDGIAKAVAIRLPHVNQYVRPLIVDGLIEERTGHIKRNARRRKVYFLTTKGRQDVGALRTTLLREEVSFKNATGDTTLVPLAKVYHEERHGATLLQLVQEANATGAVAQVVEVEVEPRVDFTQEVPSVGRFYGRTKEIEALLRALETTPIVVVTGFAGMGKTTLGAKVCETLRGKRPIFWRRIRPWDTSADLAVRIAQFLKSHGRTSVHALLSLPEARELSRVEEQLKLDLAGLHVLLVFDDVQDASPDTEAFLSLLDRVVRARTGPTVLFLSRTGLPSISRREVVLEGSVSELPLSGLDMKSRAAFLSDAGVPTPLIKRFAVASGGNPLFLQLFAVTPHQEGIERGWNAVATYIAEQVEPSLDYGERDCLEAASLFDIPVSPEALLLEGRATLKTVIGLERKGLLTQVATRHLVLHDTLKEFFQESLSPDRKEMLAAKLVVWLGERGQDAASKGDPYEAVGFLANAAKLQAERAKWVVIMEQLGQMRFLLDDLERAEQSFRSALAEAKEPRARARLHHELARVYQYDGLREDEARREIEAGLTILPAEPTPEAVALYIRQGEIALDRGDFDGAAEAARQATEIAEHLPPEGDERARAALSRVRLRIRVAPRFDITVVEADSRIAIEVFERMGNDWLASVAWGEYGNALVREGRIGEAAAAMERALSHARRSGHQENIGGYLGALASIFYEYLGDFDRAEAFLLEKLKHLKRAGLPYMLFESYVDLANLLRRQKRYEEARESLEYFLRMTADGILYRMSSTWWPGGRVDDLTLMARLCARCGDPESGENYLLQAQEIAKTRPPEMSAFQLSWAEAALRAASGKSIDAETSYRRALQQPSHYNAQRMDHEDQPRAECMLDFGKFLAARGDTEAARKMLQAALHVFSERSSRPLQDEATEALRSLDA